jgi:putative selenate reductase YgfK subunit
VEIKVVEGNKDPVLERSVKAVVVAGRAAGVYPAAPAGYRRGDGWLSNTEGESPLEVSQELDDATCIVSWLEGQAAALLAFPSAFTPVARGPLAALQKGLQQIREGAAVPACLEELEAAAASLQRLAFSPMARDLAAWVQSALRDFASEFSLHVVNRLCPAGACARLRPAPCHSACPTNIDIPSYLALVAKGRYAEALQVMREDNPFPWVCGLICPHPCERACVRRHLDAAINIKTLKAFAAEWSARHERYPPLQPQPANGHRIAVVGSGPAGLAAAHYLALQGYQVTIFESLPEAGGLLRFGIPEYRLPRAVVRREIALIEALGVEIRTGVTVGQDVTLEDLRRQGYEAFFLGVGAHQGFKLKIAGEDDFPQVLDAITFLRAVNLGQRARPADEVVVVGGGNAAMDAARTCVRLGCRQVHVAYRRTREEMPAHREEVEQALAEGVHFHFLAVPVSIGGRDGNLEYLECLRAELGEPDGSGRRRPVPVDGSNYRLAAGAVISAIGQQPDFTPFGNDLPAPVSPRNLIVTQAAGTHTRVADVFAGGDAVTGPATVVQAIAAGKQAAIDIDHYLRGGRGQAPLFQARKRARVPFTAVDAAAKIALERPPMALLDPHERRSRFDLVELGYGEVEARAEAQRCLRCDVCIRCGACERVCRDAMQVHALEFKAIGNEERILSDYHRAGERCIACGACALVCPTGAIDYIEAGDHREVRLCGTVLNRLAVTKCQRCGAPFVPERTLHYVTARSDEVMGKRVLRRLCAACAREKRARDFVKL